MAEEVIPGVPRSVAPLTRRLRSFHADYIYVSIALYQASLLPSTLSMSCSADYDTGIRSRLLFLCERCGSWLDPLASIPLGGKVKAECRLYAMCCTGRSETSSPLLALRSSSGYHSDQSPIENIQRLR
jgi:hypothetical protein